MDRPMSGRVGPALALSLLLVLGPVSPMTTAVFGSDDSSVSDRPGVGPIGSLEDRLAAFAAVDAGPADPVENEVYVVVRMKRDATIRDSTLDLHHAYDRTGAHVASGYVPLTAIRDLSTDPRVEAIRIERSRRSDGTLGARLDPNVATGVSAVGADDLQLAGVTGRNVTVGIIDTDFRVSDPELAGHVGAYRSFDGGRSDWAHGTAVASVVADTAPGANLHLAAVGDSVTAAEYREAVAWLLDSGADVVVDSGSYFGQPGDGSGEIATVAAAAAREVVFVAPTGNHAERHWRGSYDPTRDDTWVAFGPETTATFLGGGAPFAGPVRATLRWDDWNATDRNTSDYDLLLYRRQPGSDPVVATGTATDGEPVEHLTARVPRGRYYLAIRAENASTPDVDSLDLFASHSLEHASSASSLTAPATARRVLAVGALGEDGTVAPFSSRGPVAGTDRRGVDLVAPDAVALPGTTPGVGSSYAAPYAAGTAALLLDAHPTFTPAEVRTVLRNSATDLGPDGPDTASGYGRLDAAAAAEFAGYYERYADVNATGMGRDRTT
jgi:subtilisin family serine protease